MICPLDGTDCLGQDEILTAVPAVTYRQLDYWSSTGRVTWHRHVEIPGADEGTVLGSGFPRFWPATEVSVLRDVARLVDIGATVDLAFNLARSQTGGLRLGDFTLTFRRQP